MAGKVNSMIALLFVAAILDSSSSFRFSPQSSYPRAPAQYPAYNQPAYTQPTVPAYYQTTAAPTYPTQPPTTLHPSVESDINKVTICAVNNPHSQVSHFSCQI